MNLGDTSLVELTDERNLSLSEAFRDAVTGMAILDLDGRFRSANPALCAMLGRTESELMGLRTAEVTHPDDRVRSSTTIRMLLAGRLSADQVRKRYLRPDGSTVSVVRTTTVMRDPAGRAAALFSQMVDVTEADTAQETLRLSEMRFRALVAHASELTVLVDRDATIVYASPASNRLLGYAPADVEGRSAFDFLHPDDVERARSTFGGYVAGGGPSAPVEYRTLHRNGSWRNAEMVTTNLFDDPAVDALVVNIRDVTEAHEYQDRLAASEQRFRALVGNSWDVITLHDSDGRYLYCSPTVTAQLGYRPEDLLGSSPFELIHPEDGHTATLFSEAASGAASSTPIQYRLRHKNGSWRWLESTIHSRLDDPTVGGVVVTTRDVTVRRRHAAQQDAVALLSSEGLRGVPLDAFFDHAVRAVAEALGAEHSAILRARTGGRLSVAARHGTALVAEPYLRELDGQPVSLPARALRDRTSVVWGDAPETEPAEILPSLLHSGLVSGAAVVIPGNPEPYGVLSVRSVEASAFSKDDISFLEATANVLAAALGRRHVEDELRRRALHDDLTGLPNRVLLLDRIDAALTRLDRHGGCIAVLFVDTDDFKVVNDSLGHIAGDQVVTTVAERIVGVLRSTDTVARFGGDEFVVVCDDTDAHHAGEVATRIQAALAAPIDLLGRALVVTASIGIAVVTEAGMTSDDLLAQADTAMYAAKVAGKDRSVIFDASMREEVTQRLDAAAGLRQALSDGELRLFYQPVVRSDSLRVIGNEALLRWERPGAGLLPPDRFIGHAEATGLILQIGAWVLESACRQASEWSRSGHHGHVSINVSARQLAEDDIVATVRRALQTTGCDPSHVLLEVTESAVMSDLQRAAKIMAELRSLGVQVGMDDFGTGHSSLSYLANLPFDFVKIDKSFIAASAEDRRAAALLETAATLCRALGLPAIAEGVETEEQLARVRRLGIPYAQGYLFGRPVPRAESCPPAGLERLHLPPQRD